MVALRSRWLLVFAVAIAFGACLWAPYHLDDPTLLQGPGLRSSEGWTDVFLPLQTRPLTWLTFWLNFRFSTDPASLHLVNLLLHLAAVLLLVRLLPQIVDPRAAWFATVLFALHPLQTEAVVYVFARATLLATLFCLLAWQAWKQERDWAAALWFALAILAKEEVVVFPLFLWILDNRSLRRWKPLAAMLAFSAAAGARVLWAVNSVPDSGAGSGAGISPLAYLSVQGESICRYLFHLLIPVNLTLDPPVPSVAWPAAGWLLIAILSFRSRWFLLGILLLLPSSSILPAQDLAADRRMYLPIVAFALALAEVLPLRKLNPRWLYALAALWMILSVAQTRVWLTEESLWTRAVEISPSAIRPRRQLARIAATPARALEILTEAQRLGPEDPNLPNDLGRVYLQLNQPGDALRHFGIALARRPNDPLALNNRGAALLALGQKQAAQADFERAIQANPCLPGPHQNLKLLGITTAPPAHCR